MKYSVFNKDCREVLPTIRDMDAVICDPPYGLSFMGKGWDHGVPGVEFWEAIKESAKPGAHLLAFGGTRTFHRLTCAIEDAGWEIRDCVMWVYGSGFPKSLDVSKAIDKAGGASPREQSAMLRAKREAAGLTREQVAESVGCTPSSVRDWEDGRARRSGAAVEFIIPNDEYRAKLSDLLGYSADERRLIGAADDRRGDGTVYGVGHSGELRAGGNTDAARQWHGWGTALKPAWEPIIVARKPLIGTVADNVMQHGTGAINIDACRVAVDLSFDDPRLGGRGTWASDKMAKNVYEGGYAGVTVGSSSLGRFPANVIHDGSDEVVELFPGSNGSGSARVLNRGKRGDDGWGMSDQPGALRDAGSGSAARFFYCAKASKSDRGEGNNHPTVKPTSLMRYLCKLVTPPNGTILDPFMGSGSTGVAAIAEGFSFVGIDQNSEYYEIAKSRLSKAYDGKLTPCHQ